MLLALVGFVIGTCQNNVWYAASGTIIPITVWFWEVYQNYKQQKDFERIFTKVSKKISDIEKDLDNNNEDVKKQISEVKDALTWTILS